MNVTKTVKCSVCWDEHSTNKSPLDFVCKTCQEFAKLTGVQLQQPTARPSILERLGLSQKKKQ